MCNKCDSVYLLRASACKILNSACNILSSVYNKYESACDGCRSVCKKRFIITRCIIHFKLFMCSMDKIEKHLLMKLNHFISHVCISPGHAASFTGLDISCITFHM